MKLIINADDAGISRRVNDAIFALARAGKITAASIMPNMPFAAEAARCFIEETPQLAIGLHFCLTSGKPVAPRDEVPLLVDKDGNFSLGFIGILRRAIQKKCCQKKRGEFLSQVERELRAQLDWCDEQKISLKFIDGHQHIQMIPGVVDSVLAEAARRKIFVRISDEPLGSATRIGKRFFSWLRGGFAKKILLSLLARRARRLCQNLQNENSDSLNTNHVYHGVLDTGNMLFSAWNALLHSAHLRSSPHEKTVLVNVHPAICSSVIETQCSDADRAFLSHPNRAAEYEFLMSAAFQNLCDATKTRIVVSGE